MGKSILLYGATGYSGRLIAAELADGASGCDVILAGRDAEVLESLGEDLRLEWRAFGLDRRADVRAGLRDVDVVLNAAGPFAWTADRLAKVALEVGCHYVDINGEADVYKRLDDLSLHAQQRELVLVSGAGFWAAASNVLLAHALAQLGPGADPGVIRIAMSRINTFSRGSVETVWRSLREQVLVVRRGEEEDADGNKVPQLVIWHEPVGKLEERFDFGRPEDGSPDVRVASAASLVDTLAARLTAQRAGFMPDMIASYVEMGPARRLGYQVGSLLAPLAALPLARVLVQQPLELLAPGPTEEERGEEPHVVVLQIEDRLRNVLLDWQWRTPNVYQFTAQLAGAIAARVAQGGLDPGWRTPSEALAGAALDFGTATTPAAAGPLAGCRLKRRIL